MQEAKATLSLEEFTRVETWFDKGLNAVLNQLLLDGSDDRGAG